MRAAAEPGGLLYRPPLHVFALLVLGTLIYANTFSLPFAFDDLTSIVDNQGIRDFSDLGSRRFIGSLTFALNYALGGLDVRGYHLVNLIIHLSNGLLVYWFFALTLKTPRLQGNEEGPDLLRQLPFLCAVLFVCHPLQTQAVTYIVQRFTSLAALFYLLSMVLYGKARQAMTVSGGRKQLIPLLWYAGSVASTVLAMKTKEIAFTLPLMIAAFEFIFFQGKVSRRFLILLPLLLCLLIVPVTILKETGPSLERTGVDEVTREISEEYMSRSEYLITQLRVMMTYVRLLALPVNQNLDYDYPEYTTLLEGGVLASLAALLGIFVLALWLFLPWGNKRRSRSASVLTAFGIFWYFLALSVESSVIPIRDVIFEHRLYLPSAGFFLSIVSSLLLVREESALLRKAFVPGMVLMVSLFSVMTFARNSVWREGELWIDVVKKSPNKARPHFNLGAEYQARGILDRAIASYQTALRLYPRYYEAYNNLGTAYSALGRIEEAVKAHQMALSINPGFASAHTNLGIAYGKQGRLIEAIEELQTGVRLDPRHAEAHHNLGYAYLLDGQWEKARAEFRAALTLKPDFSKSQEMLAETFKTAGRHDAASLPGKEAPQQGPETAEGHYNLGNRYFMGGQFDEAIREFEAALRIRPDFIDARYNLGNAYFSRGDLDKAVNEYRTVLRVRSDHVDAHYNLGNAYFDLGRMKEALEEYRIAVRLKPDFAEAYAGMGSVYANLGRRKDAMSAYETALRLKPDYAPARKNLEILAGEAGRGR